MYKRQGYEYSINLDPDVLCLRPWDFRALVPISLVSGRRVGRGSRMVGWMQARLDRIAARQGSPATSLAALLNRTLGISARRLELTSELNGGVLVFNNLRLTRVRWLSRCVAAYAGLREVIEGDQDLIALILAADGSLPRVNLPTVYNYAYRRDRDRIARHKLRKVGASDLDQIRARGAATVLSARLAATSDTVGTTITQLKQRIATKSVESIETDLARLRREIATRDPGWQRQDDEPTDVNYELDQAAAALELFETHVARAERALATVGSRCLPVGDHRRVP